MVVVKLLLLPVIVSIAYEINRLVGRYDNWFTRIVTTPGMWFQMFTTKEPDDDMIEELDKAYKQSAFPSTYSEKLYTGGKKACLEEAFVYFYYNLKPGQDINTITIDDLYTTETINGIVVPQDQDVKYFGFQTWGSGKTDDERRRARIQS